MIRQMHQLLGILHGIPSQTPVLVTLGDDKSHDISIDGDGVRLIFSQGYGQPYTYDVWKLLAELRIYQPHAEMFLAYGTISYEIESLTYDGEILHINAKVD